MIVNIREIKDTMKNIIFKESVIIISTIIIIVVSLVFKVTDKISDICGIASVTLTYYIYRKTSLIEKKLSNMEQDNISVSSFSDLIMYLQKLLNYEVVLKEETINLVNELIVLIEKRQYEKEDVDIILILLPKLIAQIDNDNEMKVLAEGKSKE